MSIHLVTGGAGFIGSSLVQRLVEEGSRVRVLDDFSSGRMKNLAAVDDRIELIHGDMRDVSVVRQAMAGVRFVFHFGAVASVQASVEHPEWTHDVNMTGTLNVLLAARDAAVERVIFTSSSSVYGDSPEMPKREEMTPMPLSGYALSKLTGEHYCRIFHSLYGLKTHSLRYFNVFGPRQDPNSQYSAVIPLFMHAYLNGRQPVIYGDGEQIRDFTFVEDIVSANLICREAPLDSIGNAYNIAYGEGVSINMLARQIADLADCEFLPEYRPARKGDVRESQADSSLARRVLGWKPQYTFEKGLRLTFDWYKRSDFI